MRALGLARWLCGKESACQCRRFRRHRLHPCVEKIPEKGTAPHSSILAWEIPRTEEPGGLQSMGSRRAGHDWVTEKICVFVHTHTASSLSVYY